MHSSKSRHTYKFNQKMLSLLIGMRTFRLSSLMFDNVRERHPGLPGSRQPDSNLAAVDEHSYTVRMCTGYKRDMRGRQWHCEIL